MRRAANLLTMVLPLVVGLALASEPARGQIPEGNLVIDLDLVAEGLTSPVYATDAGDRSGRLFIVDQIGEIRILDANGTLLPDPFLDLTGVIEPPRVLRRLVQLSPAPMA